jgi:hypothetical protein
VSKDGTTDDRSTVRKKKVPMDIGVKSSSVSMEMSEVEQGMVSWFREATKNDHYLST